jgi:solute carrier family 25 (mitochondrial phosphate transporter), member 23/24/25/41
MFGLTNLRILLYPFNRDFLLFLPAHDDSTHLESVLSFYSSIVTLTAEGDSVVTEETLQGLGTTGSLLKSLFGSILRIASPMDIEKTRPSAGTTAEFSTQTTVAPYESDASTETSVDGAIGSLPLAIDEEKRVGTDAAIGASTNVVDTTTVDQPDSTPELTAQSSSRTGAGTLGSTTAKSKPVSGIGLEAKHSKKTRLTDFVPDPGYFLAGAIAGGVSRTATAPLDRLKVYLLVNTRASTNTVLATAKQGHVLNALKNAGRPISDAAKELWKSGGIRTFFAGEI